MARGVARQAIFRDDKDRRQFLKLFDDVVALVGGGNSAGQATVFLAAHAEHVTLLARRPLEDTMSAYLIERIAGLARRLLSCSSDEQIAAIACEDLGRLFNCNAVMLASGPEPHLIAANPRHAHEWKLFETVKLPDGKMLIRTEKSLICLGGKR